MILDAETVAFMDVTARGCSWSSPGSSSAAGVGVALARDVGQVRDILRLEGVAAPMYPSVAGAVTALGTPPTMPSPDAPPLCRMTASGT